MMVPSPQMVSIQYTKDSGLDNFKFYPKSMLVVSHICQEPRVVIDLRNDVTIVRIENTLQVNLLAATAF